MNRREFTKNIAKLILEMVEDGEQPILDYALRSSIEQNYLYEKGLSRADGYKKKSAHQMGKAADLYLVDKSVNVLWDWPMDKAEKWHKIWQEKYGGKQIILWDLGHFEG